MDIEAIELSKPEAEIKYREYADTTSKQSYIKTMKTVFFHLMRGKKLIDIRDAFRKASTKNKLPRLGFAEATAKEVRMEITSTGVNFQHKKKKYYYHWEDWTTILHIPRKTFQYLLRHDDPNRSNRYETTVPIIPPNKLPKRSKKLVDYYILWEVEDWKEIPKDPILLRRIANRLFLVVDSWDLTDVEMKVLKAL